jgi:hypothetical protein
MKGNMDAAAMSDAPILRRSDGLIDTEAYAERALALRSACVAAALRTLFVPSHWRGRFLEPPAE